MNVSLLNFMAMRFKDIMISDITSMSHLTDLVV